MCIAGTHHPEPAAYGRRIIDEVLSRGGRPAGAAIVAITKRAMRV